MNIKKLFAVLAGVSMLAVQLIPTGALAATYSQELQDAYNWAYSKGVTTMSPIDNANMYGAITRAEMAKMLSVYATEVLGMAPDASAACKFTDIDSVKGDLHDYIIESCQLGIMGQGISAFRPYDTISRAEFGTALSRVLWGSQYEGGTPYYAKHLDALKAAGIMTQISNAESTKEIRGYVMLMLMRSEGNDAVVDCDDPMTVIACTTDTDACPAACREADEPIVVKAGDLTVTAKAAEGRRAVMPGVSDLDTLTFRTSEEVTISKVVLERYGYSSQDDVDEVRLEDQDGNIIAEGKSLNKDKVTLSIKKDYRTVDGTYTATVVVRLTGSNVGGTIGFKVVDADSTAKNLNLDNYTPYTYEMVKYEGNAVTVDVKGTQDKNYNYVEGESYEIARLKVTAGSGIIYVRGFTLTNAGKLDMPEFLDKLTVKVDGEEVDGLKYSFNKEDQLVVSFDELTIDMNKSKLFVIYASLADFDEYGEHVAYYLEDKADISAVEKKTGARLDVAGTALKKTNAIRHAFNGGKIKLSNTKLGKLDASQGTEGLVIGEGNITLTEPIHKLGFTLSATGTSKAYVTRVTMLVAGEEYEAKKSGTDFTFSKVEIEKSGKIQFKIDIDDKDAAQSGTISLTPNFNGDLFEDAEYQNARKETVSSGDVSGTISFSTVTVQAAKATFKNSLSKAVEFMNQDTNEGVVFDGTYTAKKANINLNKFYMSGAANGDKIKVTYYLYIEGKEVASVDAYGTGAEETFDDIVVKAGESVKVRVVAEVEAYGAAKTLSGVQVFLGGTDDFDKDVEYKGAKLVDMKIVDRGSVSIKGGEVAKTVLLKGKNQVLAQFTIKPADGASSVEIETIQFALSNSNSSEGINSDDISVMFGNDELEARDTASFVYEDINVTIKDTVTVKVLLDEEKAGTLTLNGVKVNDKTLNKDYVTRFENAIVKIDSQNDRGGGTTRFDFDVENDDDYEVSGLKVVLEGNLSGEILGTVDDNSFIEIINPSEVARNVLSISYLVCTDEEMTTSSSTTYSCADGSDPDSEHKCGAVAGTAATPTCNTAEGWALNTETNMCDKADNDSVEPTYSCADESTPNASHMCGAVAGTPATETTETTSTCPESNRVTIDRNGTAGYPDFFLVAEKDGSTTYAKAAANK